MERKNVVTITTNSTTLNVDGAAAAAADNNDDSCNQRSGIQQKVKVPSCQRKTIESRKMFDRCRKSNSQLCATTSKAGREK